MTTRWVGIFEKELRLIFQYRAPDQSLFVRIFIELDFFVQTIQT